VSQYRVVEKKRAEHHDKTYRKEGKIGKNLRVLRRRYIQRLEENEGADKEEYRKCRSTAKKRQDDSFATRRFHMKNLASF
jgi:hypothetical protein